MTGSGVGVAFSPDATAGITYTATAADSETPGPGYDPDSHAEIQFHAAVTFDPAGGTPDPADQAIDWYGEVTEPTAPTRAGHVFDGWRVGSAAGARWDFADDIIAPLSLVAAWLVLPTISGAATASATAGAAFTWTPTITAQPGYTVLSSALPSGMTLNSSTGAITGPATGLAGDTTVTVTVMDTNGTASTNVTITVVRGAATAFSAVASDMTPDQGDTITITATASDGFGNSWDASSAVTITSNVPTDQIVGNQVTFPHASPHTLTIALPGLATQQLVIQVTAAAALGVTGSDLVRSALPLGLMAILGGLALVVVRLRWV